MCRKKATETQTHIHCLCTYTYVTTAHFSTQIVKWLWTIPCLRRLFYARTTLNNNQFALNLFVFQYITYWYEHVGPLEVGQVVNFSWSDSIFATEAISMKISYCYGIVEKKKAWPGGNVPAEKKILNCAVLLSAYSAVKKNFWVFDQVFLLFLLFF